MRSVAVMGYCFIMGYCCCIIVSVSKMYCLII